MKIEQTMFIRRLTELMEEKDLTQIELANQVGITNVTISRYLSGERKPRIEIVTRLAEVLNTTVDYLLGYETKTSKNLLPVLGTVKAGYNALADENIIDYIDPAMNLPDPKNYFGLVVKGDSMAPLFDEGDYLIIHRVDNDFDTNNIGIILIGSEEATIKKVVKTNTGIELHAFNPYYPVKRFTYEEMDKLPVKVIGIVVRQIRNWK